MIRRFLSSVLALVAAGAIGGAVGIAVWEHGGFGSSEAATNVAPAPGEPAAQRDLTINEIYERTANGVVEVRVEGAGAAPFAPSEGGATGSGFLIDSDGHVVTNQHVVGDARNVTVRFADEEERDARVLGADPGTDVALLKLEETPADATPLELGSSEELEIGDPVVAIGSPFGLQGTVTTGIVSALDRQITAPDGFTIDGAIQTDAALNRGNSGGPLLDGRARVVGMNAQIASETGVSAGIGYAVPAETIRTIVEELKRDGRVEHPYLGVRIGEAEEGAEVVEVLADSPASRAGLRAGDVIVRVAGEEVEHPDDVRRAVTDRQPGDELELELRRGGKTRTVTATLAARPEGGVG